MEKLSSPRSEKKQGKEKVNESGLGSKGSTRDLLSVLPFSNLRDPLLSFFHSLLFRIAEIGGNGFYLFSVVLL